MNKVKKKKINLLGFLIAIIITSVFMFALFDRVPIYGIASNVIVMLPEGKSQSYANHVTGNIAGIIQNIFDDRKFVGRPTGIIVKSTPTSGLITINVYEKDTAKAFKLHKALIGAMKKEVSVYYPKSTGIEIKSIGQSYKTTRISYVFGVVILSIVIGWLLTLHLSELMRNFFPSKNKEDEEYEDVGAPSHGFIKRMLKQGKKGIEKNEKDEEGINAYTWSDLGGIGSNRDVNNDAILESDANYDSDKDTNKEAMYTKIEKKDDAMMSTGDVLENKMELSQEYNIPKTESTNQTQVGYFADDTEEYKEADNFTQKEVIDQELFSTEIVNNEEKVNSEFNMAESRNELNNLTENESEISHNDLTRMPKHTRDSVIETKEIEYEKEQFDVENNNIAQIIPEKVKEVVAKERIIPQSVETSGSNLEGIDSERNGEYLNSLGPMGFDRICEVKSPNGTYEYIPKDCRKEDSDFKEVKEIRNDFNNSLASIGAKENNDLSVEKKGDKNQLDEIRKWTDVSDEVTNQFRGSNLTEGDAINLNDNDPFKEVEYTNNDSIAEVDENIFSNSNDVSDLEGKKCEIEKVITGGLALPEIEEEYEDTEKKKETLYAEVAQRQQSQKSISNSNKIPFVPSNLPIVDSGTEIIQEKIEQKDKIDSEGSEMVSEFEREPSDEDLKRRLNELLNGSM